MIFFLHKTLHARIFSTSIPTYTSSIINSAAYHTKTKILSNSNNHDTSNNHNSTTIASNKMLILSETEVQKCLPISTSIAANRKALSSLRRLDRNQEDGGSGDTSRTRAVIPTRIGLRYHDKSCIQAKDGETIPDDWTLFKPAAFYQPYQANDIHQHHQTNNNNNNNNNNTDNDPHEEDVVMGMKLVSVRANNPTLRNKPTVPATILLLHADTGEVRAVLGATYLTASRTAAGSAIATELCCSDNDDSDDGMHLVVFGAGLQAELHVRMIRHVMQNRVKKVTIVNRSLGRAEKLRDDLLSSDNGGDGDSNGDGEISKEGNKVKRNDISMEDIHCVLLSDQERVKEAVGSADVISTTTNTSVPLFNGDWVKSGCHLNGIGSYTPSMEEIDSDFIAQRCKTVVDTIEALDVGDLKRLSESSDQFVGLLGDVIVGNTVITNETSSSNQEKAVYTDCTMYKSVGTAVQDVVTAYEVVQNAERMGIGTIVEM